MILAAVIVVVATGLFVVAFLGGCAAIRRRDEDPDLLARRFIEDRAKRRPEDFAA